ncbi:MAG: hypothetical protein PF440_06585 [Thiomicrorhabdus sp.]|jgi:hypothetical protein|nr:hypothetical protein [Thiomicrorhabdus sp.]
MPKLPDPRDARKIVLSTRVTLDQFMEIKRVCRASPRISRSAFIHLAILEKLNRGSM